MMDPGRRKNEPRAAEYVSTGDVLLVDSVLWTVEGWRLPLDDLVEFDLRREQGRRFFERTLIRHRDETVTVRNTLTPQS